MEKNKETRKITIRSPGAVVKSLPAIADEKPHRTPFIKDADNQIVKGQTVIFKYEFIIYFLIRGV